MSFFIRRILSKSPFNRRDCNDLLSSGRAQYTRGVGKRSPNSPKRLRHFSRMELQLSMSRLDFFDANMAAPLGAILSSVADRFNTVRIVDIPRPVETILRKNLFLTHYWYKSLDDNHNTTMPFRRLRLSDEGEFEEVYPLAAYRKRHPQNVGMRQAGSLRKRSLKCTRMPSSILNQVLVSSSAASFSRNRIGLISPLQMPVLEFEKMSVGISIILVSTRFLPSNGHLSQITPRRAGGIPVG